MESLLEIKNITKIYKNGRGVKNINFEIYKGDIFGFLGPNGAGKTTTMKIITGLIKPDKGQVKVGGLDIENHFEKVMKKIGSIIETPEAFEYISAFHNMKMAARFYENVTDARIDEVLELVGLNQFKHEKVAAYSLGMKQRLGLASAILAKPEFVILDEPCNGLDIEGTADIRNIIAQLSAEHKITFLISSHLVHEIQLLSNRVGVINNGELIKTGLVKDILHEGTNLEDFYLSQIRSKSDVH